MAFSWDGVIAVLIIGGLVLAVWAKISGQTIVELFRDIRDFLQDRGEDAQDKLEYVNEVRV